MVSQATTRATPSDYRGELVEGVKYDGRNHSLLWVDIKRGEIHRCLLDPDEDYKLNWSAHEVITLRDPNDSVGFIGLTTSVDTVVACCKYGVGVANFLTGTFDYRFKYPHDQTRLRSNDGVIDAQGNLWIGTMTDFPYEDSMTDEGRVYRITPHFDKCDVVVPNIKIPNGMAVKDNKLFVTDSKQFRMVTYDLSETSTSTPPKPQVFFDFSSKYPGGEPDGMAYDESGLYSAVWGHGKVAHYSWQGQFIEDFDIPSPLTTCVGGQGYVTTAHPTLAGKADDGQGGSIFHIPRVINQQLHYWHI
ncbi:hypothetical protein DIURU_000355 [Diutina rugosa]|uniref:SMP-30/Gluconolactonase/LRE-like region domain-containing protein n=1 Tax=Diutina rugosa TaxID=5481 RepID=A0A642UYT7_DIURU|nr:uncharacterized protein DIURU_000355 [Diutina rugosa]KAA8907945.1 hypothetical protein DIURU_000355 [Diutina rugosa]